MTATVAGAILGAVLALSALIFGWWGFVLVALLMGVGALVGRIASGKLDVRALANALMGRRTS